MDDFDDNEPTFSLHEFKKWLSKHKTEKPSDAIKRDKTANLKSELKRRIKEKARKKREGN